MLGGGQVPFHYSSIWVCGLVGVVDITGMA
jgi:hypothetical protein